MNTHVLKVLEDVAMRLHSVADNASQGDGFGPAMRERACEVEQVVENVRQLMNAANDARVELQRSFVWFSEWKSAGNKEAGKHLRRAKASARKLETILKKIREDSDARLRRVEARQS